MAKPESPPAFPHVTQSKRAGSDTIYTHVSEGMSLRDWFAGQALNGNLAAEDMGEGCVNRLRSPENAKLMADRAYQLADAMLLSRRGWQDRPRAAVHDQKRGLIRS